MQDGLAILGGYRLVTDSAGKPFDQVTPRDVFDAVVRGDPSASHTALVYADSAFQTYFFGTREGTIGILEMLEPLTEGPNRGMRMRYKTVCRVVSKPGGNEPRVVPWKLTFEMMKVAIAVRKKEFLPNVEPMGEEPDSEMKAFLDLASGEMLAWKPEMTGETNADATGDEKGGPYFSASAGDLCFLCHEIGARHRYGYLWGRYVGQFLHLMNSGSRLSKRKKSLQPKSPRTPLSVWTFRRNVPAWPRLWPRRLRR